MAGVIPKFTTGPVTYTVAEVVPGGVLVEARPGTGKVGVAAAGSLRVLGISTKDAKPAASGASVDEFGNPVLNINAVTEFVAVGVGYYPIKYAAAAVHGDALIAAAAGQVTPAGITPDARSVIGYCAEPNGVVAGAIGLAKISR